MPTEHQGVGEWSHDIFDPDCHGIVKVQKQY